MSDTARQQYRATLEMHEGIVDRAQADLDNSRHALDFWIWKAVSDGVLTIDEVAEAVRDTAENVAFVVKMHRDV